MPTLRDLAELVRAPAALSVPGDVLAGAVAAGTLDRRATGLAGASVLLYWAGMAANDWADRHLDAVERPERPIPSGRVPAGTALGLAVGLTGAGLAVAGLAGGRRALAVALPLAGTIWGYDLLAKRGPAGPAVMATCRGLDVLLGAATGRVARAVPAALTVAGHTWTVTTLSRHEVHGTEPALPVATLAGTAAVVGATLALPRRVAGSPAVGHRAGSPAVGHRAGSPAVPDQTGSPAGPARGGSGRRVIPLPLVGWYAWRYGGAQARAVAAPDAARVRAAVGTGITELPALQGALIARAGSSVLGAAVALAAPLGRRLARKLSPT